ncbi:MAG: aldo/keto reductase [Janthinobacterium lividum]
MQQNMVYVQKVREIGERHGGASPAAVALAWLLHQGEHVVPIPGMIKHRYLDDNVRATTLALSRQEMAELDALPPAFGSA